MGQRQLESRRGEYPKRRTFGTSLTQQENDTSLYSGTTFTFTKQEEDRQSYL